MKKKIIKLLSIINIRQQERYPVFFLLMQAFFLGTFNGLFYILSHSLFLKSGFENHIPEAFTIAGGVSLILLIIYKIFTSTLSYRKAKPIFSAFLGVLIISLLLLPEYIKIQGYHLILFSFVFPFQIVTLQSFNSSINRFYHGKQSIRFYGILNNSREFGFIAIGYILPVLVFLNVKVEYMLYLSILAYLLNFLFELLFIRSTKDIPVFIEKKKTNTFKILTNRFTRQLVLFLFLSALVGYLIHYAFITITKDNIDRTIGLIKFFGLYMSTLLLFNYLANKFLLNRVLNNLGLPYSIILSPIFTGLFIIIALVVGWRFGIDKTITSGYMFFFLFFAAGKFIERMFKYSVETPSSNILLTSLKSVDLFALKEFIQAPLIGFSLLVTGLLLLAKSYFAAFNLIYLSIIIIGISILWFLVSIRLIKRYRNNLKLRYSEIGLNKDVKNHLALPLNNKNILYSNFQENNDEKSLYLLKILKSVSPVIYVKHILNYLNQYRKDTLLSYILTEVGRYDLNQAIPILQDFTTVKNNDLKFQISKLESYLNDNSTDDYTYEQIIEVIFSSKIIKKKKVIRLIALKSEEDINKILPLLLKDIEPDIVFMAMLLSKNLKADSCLEIITNYMLSEQYYAMAYNVLIEFGDISISYIDELYFNSEIDQKQTIRLTRLLGDIPSKHAIPVLLEKFNEISSKVRKEAVISLRKHKFRATDEQVNIIMRQIIRAVEICNWNISLHLQFRKLENNDAIIFAINKELNENYLSIFGLLCLLYDDQKLNYIYSQIDEGNSEILAYAIELLDFILDDDLKNILFPLFENSSFEAKINQLQYYFPTELSKNEETIKKAINRESNNLSVWTKTCAIYYCRVNPKYKLVNELVSCMFHPEKIIRETAAYILYLNYPEEFKSAYLRLNNDYISEIDLSLEFLKITERHLIYHRVQYLKESIPQFAEIPDDQIVEFVSSFNHYYLETGEVFSIPDEEQAPLVWVFNGTININTRISVIYQLSEGNITDLVGVPYIQNITAKEGSMLYIMNRNKLNELLFDNKELLKAFLLFMDSSKIFNDEVLRSHYEKVLI